MSYDAGLVARVADALEQLGERGVRQKNVFGGRGFLRGRRTFVVVWNDGLLIPTAPGEYTRALDTPGVTRFAPAGERAMGRWVVVAAEVVAEDPELAEWVARGLRGIA